MPEQPSPARSSGLGPDLDVLVIGAGFSGVCMGYRLKKAGIDRFRIVEKADGVGGTWLHNTYPGAACDVPSHLYCFSFAPKPDWSRVYAPQPEIKAYIEDTAERFGLMPHIRLGTQVDGLDWDEAGYWRATLDGGEVVTARHVVSGAGGLHEPNVPDVPGREDFVGPAMHTARWDHSVETAGKRVGVVGSAASAIQAIPELAKTAAQVVVFQRTPNYVAPRGDRVYTDEEKRRFARFPLLAKLYRTKMLYQRELLLYPITKKDSKQGVSGGEKIKAWIRAVVADESLHDALSPDYVMGCKRILISDDFYATLNRDNVTLVPHGLERVERDAVVAGGERHPLDVIVWATGFDLDSHQVSIPMRGPNGTLTEAWADISSAYKGAAVAGFPNFYMVTGPNTGVATTSVVHMVEQQTAFILKLIQRAGSGVVSVKPEAQAAYNETIQADLAETVWAQGGCESWYRREDGRISTLYPYNGLRFAKQMRKVDMDDFVVRPASDVLSGAAA